jgi:hypothetical protein
MKYWKYSLTTNTVWTSFDYGEVIANTYEEALVLAEAKLKSHLDAANAALEANPETKGMDIGMYFDNITVELNKQKSKRYDMAMDIGFVVYSDNEQPNDDEILAGLKRRIKMLEENPSEIKEAVGAYDIVDTYEE